MDNAIVSSLRDLRESGLDDPKRFFDSVDEVLTEMAEAGTDVTVDEFTTRFTDKAAREGFAAAGEQFTRYLRDNDGADVLGKLTDENADALVAEYENLLTDAQDAGTADGDSYDETAWFAFLAEYGAQWNGEADTWDAFRTWFLYYAGERGLTAPATSFLDHADGEADRVAFFAQYGVRIEPAGQAAAEPADDPAQWQAFLTEFGPSWNGAEDTWDAFTPYFLYYADERGVAGSARAFVDNAPADNTARVEYFRSYDVALTQPAESTGSTEAAQPASPEQVQAQFEEIVQAASDVPPEFEDAVGDAFAELIQQMPEAANLTPEQMQEILESAELQDALDSIESTDNS